MKMKAYVSFDEYLENQGSKNQEIIRALRKFVKRVEPGLSETVKWGNGCWIGRKGPVAYVYSDTGCVQFGFFNGSSLKDPKGLLEGKGRYVRHTKVRAPSEIDERAFAALLRQAAG
jgi:hypothetical protein